MGWLIGAVLCFFMSVLMALTALGASSLGTDATQEIIICIIMLALGLFFQFRWKKSSTANRKRKRKEERQQLQNEKEHAKVIDQAGHITELEHMAGLPLAEKSKCSVSYGTDKIVLNGAGTEFNLPLTRVLDVTVKTNTEIQKSYVSSVGGAVGGAVLFGPLGAMIGGRAKEKKTTKIDYYFIITYKKEDGGINYLSFLLNEKNLSNAKAAESLFSQRHIEQTQSINL